MLALAMILMLIMAMAVAVAMIVGAAGACAGACAGATTIIVLKKRGRCSSCCSLAWILALILRSTVPRRMQDHGV